MGEIIGLIGILGWAMNLTITWQGFNRIKAVYYANVSISIVLAIAGIVLFPKKIADEVNSNVAGILFIPLLFVILHIIMSRAYNYLYGFPADPGTYMSNQAKYSNRKLNFLDHLVIIIPAMLSFLIGIMIARL